ncbi:MAG: M20/M25/M40 family metallo-hydrolase [Chloroflexi bacterium]|nr:M20/M25/M40 family metallo-hydrolase [Chloroflexota bacterium]
MNLRALAHGMLEENRDEIIRVVQDLVHIPSQNMPPGGQEKACQEYIAAYLGRAGLPASLYEPDQVPGLVEHPSYWPGRSYRDRPNVSSCLAGRGGGRSLLLTGHVDTVALGENVWTYPPFGAEIHDGKLYGLGSIDMKGPMGATLVLYKAIAEKGLRLKGALSYESVVDEEEGGVNATIAGRLRDGAVDGALIPEGTDLKVYPAARGALICDFIFRSTKGTWLDVGKSAEPQADAVKQMGLFLAHIDELSALRRQHPVHSLYTSYPDPVPVQVTKVYAGGWGNQVPIAVPPEGRIELIVQTLPGEEREDVYREMMDWLEGVMARYPDAFIVRPEIRYRLRWMVPTAIDPRHPLVLTMADCARQVMGHEPAILGAPYACDMFALHQIFDIPGIVFGPAGANAHAADEYVDLESLFVFWEALLLFVLNWCGVED